MTTRRTAVTFRQLCAVAKDRLLHQATTTSVDWKEAIKARVVALGYRDPVSAEVYRAMDATERAHPGLRARIVDPPPTTPAPPMPVSSDPTAHLPRPRAEYAPGYQASFTPLQELLTKYTRSSRR